MNARVVKQLRKQIYGDQYSPRFRTYRRVGVWGVIADSKRRAYQKLKKEYYRKRI